MTDLQLIQSAKAGEPGAFEELLSRYAPLIESMTEKFATSLSSQGDKDDLRQEAVLGFYRALTAFDTQQTGVQFGLYAKTCIRNALISHLRRDRRHEDLLPLDAELYEEENTDPAQLLLEEESFRTLYRTVKRALSPYENRVWWLFLSGMTAREIAKSESTDEKSVQNAIYRIRHKLRRVLSDH